MVRTVIALLVFALLVGAQCMNVCAINPCNDTARTESSCHHSDKPTGQNDTCVHQVTAEITPHAEHAAFASFAGPASTAIDAASWYHGQAPVFATAIAAAGRPRSVLRI